MTTDLYAKPEPADMLAGLRRGRVSVAELLARPLALVFYGRISDDGAGAGMGVKRQLAAGVRYIAQYELPAFSATFKDNDKSAKAGSKPRDDWEALKAEIAAGRVGVVVAWHIDRMTRDPAEWERFASLCKKHGTMIRTVTAGELDPSTPMGAMAARQAVNMAAYESDVKSDRITEWHIGSADAGRFTGGKRRFGFTASGMRHEPTEAAAVRDMAEWIIAGVPCYQVAKRLTAAGILTATGKPWRSTNIPRLLKGTHLIGKRRNAAGELVDAAWQPILELDQWTAVNAILGNPERRTAPTTARRHLLSGLAVCGVEGCGATVVARVRAASGNQPPAYQCRRRADAAGTGPSAPHIHRQMVGTDLVIRDAVVERLAMVDAAGVLTPDAGAPDELTELRDKLAAIDGRLRNMRQLYLASELDEAEWKAGRADAAALKAPIQKRLDARAVRQYRPKTVLKNLAGNPDAGAIFDGMDNDEKRAVIAALGVPVIMPGARKGARFDPALIDMKWHTAG